MLDECYFMMEVSIVVINLISNVKNETIPIKEHLQIIIYFIWSYPLFISLSEDDIALAILRLVEVEKAVLEGAGATGLAACLSGKLNHLKGKK